MRQLVADFRFGLSGLSACPGTGGRSAAWLLAGVLLGGGLSHWLDAMPVAAVDATVRATTEPLRVKIDAVFSNEPEAIGRLRCLAGGAPCPQPATLVPPCEVPRETPLQS